MRSFLLHVNAQVTERTRWPPVRRVQRLEALARRPIPSRRQRWQSNCEPADCCDDQSQLSSDLDLKDRAKPRFEGGLRERNTGAYCLVGPITNRTAEEESLNRRKRRKCTLLVRCEHLTRWNRRSAHTSTSIVPPGLHFTNRIPKPRGAPRSAAGFHPVPADGGSAAGLSKSLLLGRDRQRGG